MSWSGGVFTRAGGSQNWVDDRDAAVLITAPLHDAHDQDLADGINACLAKDGSNAMTGVLAMGTNKITGLGTPTASTDAATKAYVDAAGSIAFVSGDQLIFRNAGGTAPTGWAVAAKNNTALRIVSGVPSERTAGSSFTTVFGTSKVTGAEAAHTHTYQTNDGSNSQAVATVENVSYFSLGSHYHAGTTSAGSSHTHTLSLDLNYYEMNVIQKT